MFTSSWHAKKGKVSSFVTLVRQGLNVKENGRAPDLARFTWCGWYRRNVRLPPAEVTVTSLAGYLAVSGRLGAGRPASRYRQKPRPPGRLNVHWRMQL